MTSERRQEQGSELPEQIRADDAGRPQSPPGQDKPIVWDHVRASDPTPPRKDYAAEWSNLVWGGIALLVLLAVATPFYLFNQYRFGPGAFVASAMDLVIPMMVCFVPFSLFAYFSIAIIADIVDRIKRRPSWGVNTDATIMLFAGLYLASVVGVVACGYWLKGLLDMHATVDSEQIIYEYFGEHRVIALDQILGIDAPYIGGRSGSYRRVNVLLSDKSLIILNFDGMPGATLPFERDVIAAAHLNGSCKNTSSPYCRTR